MDGLNLKYEEVEKAEYLLPIFLNKMLDKKITAFKTTDYDDFINGIDGFSVFENKDDVLAYAMDFTITKGDNLTTLKNKFQKIFDNINDSEPHLSKIKYFRSKTKKGLVENVPRVILSFKDKDITKFEKIYKEDKFENNESYKFLFLFFEEIRFQLEKLIQYTEKKNIKNLQKIYEDVFENIDEIYWDSIDEMEEKIGREGAYEILDFVKNHGYIQQIDEAMSGVFG